jgi:phosphoserine phosphatase RsbU/P
MPERQNPPGAVSEPAVTLTGAAGVQPRAPAVAALTAEDKLRDLQFITDAELSGLQAGELLTEVLDRLKEIMRADTAAVLLLDDSGTYLVATAASGLEEEVRQGVRIPVGRGFAGRIAAERRPVIIDHVDHTNVVNPILLTKGIRSLIGVPLLASGTVIGVLHVGSLGQREFTDDDAALLQLAADRAAVAVHILRSRADRAAAATLARSLLPARLPEIGGLEMAARYVPRDRDVGGDWYDVFVLPTGELCVVMGDVAGAGLHAAVTMGRMRSALRAYALETQDPAEVLRRLDRKMQHFEPDAIATVIYAVFARDLDHVRVSSAGHLPPVIALPGHAAELADIRNDLLIGMSLEAPRHSATLHLPPGCVLCFYTDGLVERRGRVIDEGLEALCGTIVAGPAEVVCAAAMTLVGSEPSTDDTSILVCRREAC